MRKRATSGRNVVLTPETALSLCSFIEDTGRPLMRGIVAPFDEGSAVYRVDDKGDIVELVAFARSALVARAAFDYLCDRFPEGSYSQRRRAWVEAERIVRKAREGR